MFEKLAESKNESSNRRRFLRRIAGLTAVSALAGLIHTRSEIDQAFAANGSGLIIGQANSGSSETSLTASPGGDAAFKVETKSGSGSSKAIYGLASALSGTVYGVWGTSNSVDGTGVIGSANASTGDAYGVYGSSESIEGIGVYGYANASSGYTTGVHGYSDSIDGKGVYGGVNASTGITYGVYGASSSINGRGVHGTAIANTGSAYGVYGTSQSVNGRGVYGLATRQSGTTYGVYGQSDSVSGYGVYGVAGASTGTTYGVYGVADSQSGTSIYALAGNTGTTPMVARGASGQTASLQEWQNNAGTELSVINKDGYLGVGIRLPETAIHLKSSSSNPAIKIENENQYVGQFIYCYSNTHLPFFSGRRARGTTFSPTAVQTDDILMRYGGSGYGSTGFPGGNRAILEFKAAQTWTDSNQGTYITFSTTPNNSNVATERMRITAAGEIIPPTDNTGSIGTASRRWSLVRANTVTSGDLVFENGVRATEEGKGIAFKNDAGEKIAVLDREGNFHIKGDIIKDL